MKAMTHGEQLRRENQIYQGRRKQSWTRTRRKDEQVIIQGTHHEMMATKSENDKFID
jgi:hypothetical protein